ncbi:MAG TPA: helix-turn-helix domain-containing protein [bacterium]|nr:helix-turn-helix domain-containing protein [bacterium]
MTTNLRQKENMELEELLIRFELNEKQIKIYLILLQMGSGTIQEIMKQTKLKRTTIYSVLDSLISRGLVTFSRKTGHRTYTAEDPKLLPRIFEKEERKIHNRQKTLVEALPLLASLYNSSASRPKIRMYDGIDGIKTVFEETLLLPPGTETLAYASYTDVRSHLGEWIHGYIKRRAERGITQRCIAEDSLIAREELVKNDKQDLRVTKLVNKDQFPFSIEQINIYSNKIFIASYQDLLAVVIESAPIATAMKSIFELAWIGAKQVRKA